MWTYFWPYKSTEIAAISISVQMLNCSLVSPRFKTSDRGTSKRVSDTGLLQLSISHIPPMFSFPLPLPAAQVGQRMGNLLANCRTQTEGQVRTQRESKRAGGTHGPSTTNRSTSQGTKRKRESEGNSQTVECRWRNKSGH
jgi:hypothetical protein